MHFHLDILLNYVQPLPQRSLKYMSDYNFSLYFAEDIFNVIGI